MDDRAEIIDTVNRYATALDGRDWGLLETVFTEDAVGDYGAGELAGRDRLIRMISRMLGRCGPTQHLLSNHVVACEGDLATCVTQIRAFHASADPNDSRTYELFGQYEDRLKRTPAGWRIVARRLAIRHESGSREVLGT